jgi:bifunctional non-homologous end joining protein LigD
VGSDAFSITSANGRDATASFPELEPGAHDFPVRGLLDGEIIATDERGRPSFGRLQQRMHVSSRAEASRRAATVPACLVVFDVLELDGRDVTSLTYADRRALLERLFDAWDRDPRWQLAVSFDDGTALLDAVTTQGLEGVVAKRVDSKYEVGRRSRSWVKVKVRLHQELVIGGWLPGERGRAGRIGALLVGYHDQPRDGLLRYAGRVGTGFTEPELDRLAATFAEITTDACPFEPPPSRAEAPAPTWLEPTLVCEVAFTEWTTEERLRHPVYLGLRHDKAAADVLRE